jgi:predicted  nucleic acid-binding Zn-ribbon protein
MNKGSKGKSTGNLHHTLRDRRQVEQERMMDRVKIFSAIENKSAEEVQEFEQTIKSIVTQVKAAKKEF